jgi:hypothetical protein
MGIVLVKEKETPCTWRFKDKEGYSMTIYLTKEQVKELGHQNHNSNAVQP